MSIGSVIEDLNLLADYYDSKADIVSVTTIIPGQDGDQGKNGADGPAGPSGRKFTIDNRGDGHPPNTVGPSGALYYYNNTDGTIYIGNNGTYYGPYAFKGKQGSIGDTGAPGTSPFTKNINNSNIKIIGNIGVGNPNNNAVNFPLTIYANDFTKKEKLFRVKSGNVVFAVDYDNKSVNVTLTGGSFRIGGQLQSGASVLSSRMFLNRLDTLNSANVLTTETALNFLEKTPGNPLDTLKNILGLQIKKVKNNILIINDQLEKKFPGLINNEETTTIDDDQLLLQLLGAVQDLNYELEQIEKKF